MSEQFEVETPSESRFNVIDENIFSVIRNRRATRSYSSKQVSEEIVRSLIDFSIQAPSAINLQPWSFVIVQNPVLLKEISDLAKKKLSSGPIFTNNSGKHEFQFLSDPDFNIFYDASTLIIICAKTTDMGFGDYNSEPDCFLAGENLMLAATGMGLGTCPIGLATEVLREPELRKRLGTPADFTPVLPIIVGYPSSSTPHVDRNPPIIKWVK
ncbi:MAG: nitroreductase family protein [Bacteriovorax sp.]